MASWEGWRILLFLNEGFLFGQALEMTLSHGTAKDLDRDASSKVYRSLLEEILRRDCFPGAQVEVLILPSQDSFQHHLSGPGNLTRERRQEATSKLYGMAFELWRSQEWLVWKWTGLPQPDISVQN